MAFDKRFSSICEKDVILAGKNKKVQVANLTDLKKLLSDTGDGSLTADLQHFMGLYQVKVALPSLKEEDAEAEAEAEADRKDEPNAAGPPA